MFRAVLGYPISGYDLAGGAPTHMGDFLDKDCWGAFLPWRANSAPGKILACKALLHHGHYLPQETLSVKSKDSRFCNSGHSQCFGTTLEGLLEPI